jgi:hypothetical protein
MAHKDLKDDSGSINAGTTEENKNSDVCSECKGASNKTTDVLFVCGHCMGTGLEPPKT